MSVLRDLPSVETLEGCDPQQIPSHVFESEVPIVLKGLVSEWPAAKACSRSLAEAAKYLSAYWVEKPVTVYVGDSEINGRFGYNTDFTDFNFKSGYGQLSMVLQKLSEEPDDERAKAIYVGSTAVDEWLPGFRERNDVTVPGDDVAVSFWLGNRTHVSAHFDFPDNIACVVAGRRRFTLFPPDQIGNLYIGPIDRTPAGQAISLVDIENPDFERFPKFREALESAISYEMEPGDAIFIPGMWWHTVQSLSTFNLLVNYWWCPTPAVMGSPMTALMHSILSIRELPERYRAAWRDLFDHYVFSADESVYEHIPEPGRGCLAPLDEKSAARLRAFLASRFKP